MDLVTCAVQVDAPIAPNPLDVADVVLIDDARRAAIGRHQRIAIAAVVLELLENEALLEQRFMDALLQQRRADRFQ